MWANDFDITCVGLPLRTIIARQTCESLIHAVRVALHVSETASMTTVNPLWLVKSVQTKYSTVLGEARHGKFLGLLEGNLSEPHPHIGM